MNKDGSSPTNPMLYDPIPEGAIQTTKKMQFLAASAGKYWFYSYQQSTPTPTLYIPHNRTESKFISFSMASRLIRFNIIIPTIGCLSVLYFMLHVPVCANRKLLPPFFFYFHSQVHRIFQ